MALLEKAESFPARPGVYLMKGPSGDVLYVGKAKNLRNRVTSYFQAPGDSRTLITFLMEKVADIECLVTETEKEALILEDTLIKRYRPRYNVRFRDDKTYVNLRLTVKDEYPRLHVVRRPVRDGSLVFGPYPSSQAVRETLKLVQKIFPLRSCTDADFARRTRPCIQYQIKQCTAPCVGYIDKKHYDELVREVILFLQGKNTELHEVLRKRMTEAAGKESFEEAARLRDLISSIDETLEKQRVVLTDDRDVDIFAWAADNGSMAVQVLNMRKGVLLGGRAYPIKSVFPTEDEVLSAVVYQYYLKGENVIPEEIVVSGDIVDREALAERLTELKGESVRISVAERGDMRRLARMAEENARASLTMRTAQEEDIVKVLTGLQEVLGLRSVPRRIEAYDISNISGTLAVGSLVAWHDGRVYKDGYRRFRIKNVPGIDDYGMMYEVLSRRFSEGWELPDLMMVDGGKGQLNVALAVMKEKGAGIDAVGLAKGEPDKVYVPHIKDPVTLRKDSPELLFLQRIRDEAHRFALSYHIKLRSKRDLHSALDEIAGVGEKRKAELLRHFASVEVIKNAGVEEIAGVPLVGLDLAQTIYKHFHP